MSAAREKFLREIGALTEAVLSPRVGSASGISHEPGIAVLRRGAAIAGLVMLETFIRDRTEEILIQMQYWPAQFRDLPERFRRRATIDAFFNVEKYARMLRRNDQDYQTEIIDQAGIIASMSPPSFKFSKFIGGDYTGNISTSSTEDLLKVFQIKDCWSTMHSLSVEIGFGAPSIKEVLNAVIRNRHQSAHVAGHVPTVADILELPQNIQVIGICVDTALSASIEAALNDWREWVGETFDWKRRLEIYFIVRKLSKLRLVKSGATRAIRVFDTASEARSHLPKKRTGITRLLVERGEDGRPKSWDIA